MRPGDFSPGNHHNADGRLLRREPASMRPGDFSPGNRSVHGPTLATACRPRFNEAGGFLPRKPAALGHLRRAAGEIAASMRPGDFSPGNERRHRSSPRRLEHASMRPGDFSPGNRSVHGPTLATACRPRFNEAGGFLPRKPRPRAESQCQLRMASMRPGDFSPGNAAAPGRPRPLSLASMRPGDFSPGNPAVHAGAGVLLSDASMRPGDFSPGNPAWSV